MKKKETLWQLLKRLDEQGGQFNLHLAAANRYFDVSAEVTRNLLDKHERDVHAIFAKIKSRLRKKTRSAGNS